MKSYETSPLAQQMIQEGMPIKDLWQERFSPIASQSDGNQQVAIVDRYAVPNIINGRDGLFNLLKLLHSDSPGCEVTIFSQLPDSADEVRRRLDAEIANLGLSKDKGIRNIQVFLCPRDLIAIVHDRYVRFNAYTCEIGTGVEVFSGSKVLRNSAFSLKPPTQIQAYRDIEDNLREGARDVWRWPRHD